MARRWTVPAKKKLSSSAIETSQNWVQREDDRKFSINEQKWNNDKVQLKR